MYVHIIVVITCRGRAVTNVGRTCGPIPLLAIYAIKYVYTKFDAHVSGICKKASKQLAVLKRLGRFLTKQGKLVIYNSFIASYFSYCPLAWHFVV